MIKISIKILKVNFGNSILDHSKSGKISEVIANKKKSKSRTEWDSIWEVKR